MTGFAFHVTKKKGRILAALLADGMERRGVPYRILEQGQQPTDKETLILYGVMPSNYDRFLKAARARRAIYLDNGWLSRPETPTYRFSWNSVQPFLSHLLKAPARLKALNYPAPIERVRPPNGSTALVCLQSPDYFHNLRLPFGRDEWLGFVQRNLTDKGYTVAVREKPRLPFPGRFGLEEQIDDAALVLSLNSATSLRAMERGVPAVCTAECTLTPIAPNEVRSPGQMHAPYRDHMAGVLERLASTEFTTDEMQSGAALDLILSVTPDRRRGIWYASGH